MRSEKFEQYFENCHTDREKELVIVHILDEASKTSGAAVIDWLRKLLPDAGRSTRNADNKDKKKDRE